MGKNPLATPLRRLCRRGWRLVDPADDLVSIVIVLVFKSASLRADATAVVQQIASCPQIAATQIVISAHEEEVWIAIVRT